LEANLGYIVRTAKKKMNEWINQGSSLISICHPWTKQLYHFLSPAADRNRLWGLCPQGMNDPQRRQKRDRGSELRCLNAMCPESSRYRRESTTSPLALNLAPSPDLLRNFTGVTSVLGTSSSIQEAGSWSRCWKLIRAGCCGSPCNPSDSGGRDQEDHGSKPAWAKSSQDPISKKLVKRKKGWGSGSRYRSWVQIPVPQKKKKLY
jgi:hypothetical protein